VEKNVTNHHESVRSSRSDNTQKKSATKKEPQTEEREMILSFVLLKQKVPKPFSSTHRNFFKNLPQEIIREEDEFYSKRSRLNSCTHTAQF